MQTPNEGGASDEPLHAGPGFQVPCRPNPGWSLGRASRRREFGACPETIRASRRQAAFGFSPETKTI